MAESRSRTGWNDAAVEMGGQEERVEFGRGRRARTGNTLHSL